MQGYFTLNNFCNQKCLTCPTGSNCKDNSFIPFDILKKRILESKNKGMDSLILSGGEPFAYPYIIETLEFLYKYNIRVTILTNGTLINKKTCDKLKKIKKNLRIVIAIHSDASEEHDLVTQTVGSFNKVVENILYLDQNNFNLCFKIILNAITSKKMREIACMLEYKLKNKFLLNICSMDMCNISNDNLKFCLTGKEIYFLLDSFCKWYMFKKNKKFGLQLSEFPVCLMSKFSMPFLVVGKPRMNFAFIGRGNSQIIYNNKYDCYPCFSYCNNCRFENICPGIWTSNKVSFMDDCKPMEELK